MNELAISCRRLTKRFRYKEPSVRNSTGDMWVHYLLGKLRQGGDDPLAPVKTELVAVDELELEVHRGELFGLLGPNGAGKTTLVKMLATILLPNDGAALVNGFDVATQPTDVRRSITVISSGGWLGFDMQLTIEWNLKYWATLYGMPLEAAQRRVRDALAVVQLEDKARETSAVLSSGMRQRLAIAKGLLIDAPIFLMDEPTVALDPRSANDIRSFIKEEIRHKKRTTILLTTHNMQEAEELCDRVGIMHRGRLIACGSPAELKRQMPSQVFHIVGSNLSMDVVRDFRERFDAAHWRYKISSEFDAGWLRFHLNRNRTSVAEMRSFLTERGVTVRSLDQVEPNLEDLFFDLTGKGLEQDALRN